MTDLIKATPESEILRRDIFDRAPIFKWADGKRLLCPAGQPGTRDRAGGARGRAQGWKACLPACLA